MATGRTITAAIAREAGQNPATKPTMAVGSKLIRPSISGGRAAASIGNSPARSNRAMYRERRRRVGLDGG